MTARSPEGDDDDVVLRIESGDQAVRGDRWAAALLAAAGADPFALVERAVERAAALSGARPCCLLSLCTKMRAEHYSRRSGFLPKKRSTLVIC